jgi:ABC-type Na+ efflux pump permease subunit
MTFLPIVARELRVAARRPLTYWVRSGAALIALLLVAWVLLMMWRQRPSELGKILFGITTGVTCFLCLVSGMRVTADCISEEKRNGTLGLLFLTDLKGYDVVFGKLAASSLSVSYAAVSVVPIMAIPMLLGGVALGEFARMTLVAFNAMFFSLTVGLFVSTVSVDARRAVGLALFLLLVFSVLVPAAGGMLAVKYTGLRSSPLFYLTSPGTSYVFAFDQSFRSSPSWFYGSLATVHAMSWAFLALACWLAPRTWQDKASRQPSPLKARLRSMACGGRDDTAQRRVFLDLNPVLWLATRAWWRPMLLWMALLLLAAAWGWWGMKFKDDFLSEPIFIMTGLLLHMLLKGSVASEASRTLADERQQGTLELLLSTPVTIRDIVKGHQLTVQRFLLGPFAVVVVVDLIMMFAGLSKMYNAESRVIWVCVWISSLIVLVADILALFWVGLWQGLTARDGNRASGNAISQIVFLPWALYALLSVLTTLAFFRSNMGEGAWMLALAAYLGLSLGVDVVMGNHARVRLLRDFREMATRRYERKGFWSSLFSRG